MAVGNGNAPGVAITVKDLVKRYGEVEAVSGVSLEVGTGEVFGFLGPNGAGKSTTINMLCTLVNPTSGTARVAGHDIVRARDDVRRHIGLVFQDQTLDTYLTAEANLKLHAELYGIQSSLVDARMEQVMTMVGLWERRGGVVSAFSGGMRRRLEIARGLMHSPRVLFLDEPTIGLDPQTRRSIWSYIRQLQLREQITIFMTTHYMDEAEWCDRIAIMDHGKIVALDTPVRLKQAVSSDRVTLHTDSNIATIARLKARFDIDAKISQDAVIFGVPDGERFLPRLFAQFGLPIRSVSVSRPTLDDVFLAYTGSSIRDAEADESHIKSRMIAQRVTGAR
jgi:ABC-2 type transport system ATP-binding protein